MATSDGNDTQGTPLGLHAQPLPLPALAQPARKYHPLMELGRGGSAVVSAALARGIGGFTKLVVLKTTKEELCGHADARSSSLNEARLAARMNHPNIVQVYEVYQENGMPVIVMEYLDGLSLARVARQGTPVGQTLQLALSVLCKVLEGVRYAHRLSDFDGRPLGIVHRDISPQNVMLTYDGQVKLVDFGTAKLMESGEPSLSGMLRGKLGYMPPEQVCAEAIDGRVDVFAVGVMLWEAVAGRRLWGQLNDAGIVRRLLEHDIPRLRDALPDVDPELDRICSRALAPDRDQRYPDADSFLRELEQYVAARGGAVPAIVLGEMVQHSCAELKRAREEALRAALTQVEDGHFDADDEGPEPTRTQLQLPGSLRALQVPGRARRRRRALWASFVIGCLLAGIGLARYTITPLRAELPLAPPVVAAAALPAAVALAAPPPQARAGLAAVERTPQAAVEAASSDEPVSDRPRAGKRASKRAPRAARTARQNLETPATAVALPQSSCDPPYSIDEHGIKRFHRDCLR